MRSRFAYLVLGVLLMPAAARADSHFADFYGGGSGGGGGSTLGGFVFALGVTPEHLIPGPCKLGFTGGVSGQFGSHDGGRDVTQVVWGGGPRCTFTKAEGRTFLHVHAQFNGVYTNDGSLPNDKAVVVGASYDFAFKRTVAGPGGIRVSNTHGVGFGVRGQYDRIFNLGDRESVQRFSGGVIYRFPKLMQ